MNNKIAQQAPNHPDRCTLCGKTFKIGFYKVTFAITTEFISTGEIEREKGMMDKLDMAPETNLFTFYLGGNCAYKLIKCFERVNRAPYKIALPMKNTWNKNWQHGCETKIPVIRGPKRGPGRPRRAYNTPTKIHRSKHA